MAEIDFNLYKTPSDEILWYRKELYDLWRRTDDETTTWLHRIQSQFNRCDFPLLISREYMLIDRFVCGLNDNEKDFMRSVSTWTLMELTKYLGHRKEDGEASNFVGNIESPSPSVVAVKCEFVSMNSKQLFTIFCDSDFYNLNVFRMTQRNHKILTTMYSWLRKELQLK